MFLILQIIRKDQQSKFHFERIVNLQQVGFNIADDKTSYCDGKELIQKKTGFRFIA